MIAKSIALALLIVLVRAGSMAAQTSGELLQKGIYTQDTAGDLDAAIKIYRQVLGSAPARDIGAQAQYRLAESLLKKGDLTGAGQEFQTLARLYPDQQVLVTRLAARFPRPVALERAHLERAAADPRPDLFQDLYDPNRPVVVRGVVANVEWTNPRVVIYVGTADGAGTKSAFTIGAPNALLRGGWNKNTIKVGNAIEIHGLAAKPTGADPSGTNRTLPGGRILDDNTTLHAAARMIILPESDGTTTYSTDGVSITNHTYQGRDR